MLGLKSLMALMRRVLPLILFSVSFLGVACSRQLYEGLPRNQVVRPPWYSSLPSFPNSFGFKNLGTGYTPSTLYLSDNVADGGDVISVALNGQIVLSNFRIRTPDNSPPQPVTLALKPGPNRVDIACILDPDDYGCTLQAEISTSTAGKGITTLNENSIPQGEFASFHIEFKPAQ